MKRRDFLALTGAAALAVPLRALAQQQATAPVVAIFNINVQGAPNLNAVAVGLAEAGLLAGRDYVTEAFYAEGRAERLPDLMAAVLQRRPAVILAGGGIFPVQTARQATSTIPIVFTSGVDPVATGVVQSMSRPGGNITGVYILGRELDAKRVEVLHDLAPATRRIGLLTNPKGTPPDFASVADAGVRLSMTIHRAEAASDGDLDAAFAEFARQQVEGVVMASDPVITADPMRSGVIARAAAQRLPVICESRQFPDAGGFASYGPNVPDVHRLAGSLAGRIMRGAMPGDLPILQPTKFELVINNTTAKALGVTVPREVIFRADQVIE